MAEPSSFTSRLLQQAMQPATRVPFAAAMQPTQAAPTSAQSTAAQRQRTAYLAALANPDMPIEPQFSTGSATADEQAIRRARAARMLAAGQAAVAERAQAQGRLQGTDPVTGAPIVGAATPSPIVQESPGGVRVAYRNGVPVGFSTMTPPAQRPVTPTALLPQESAAVRQEATRLAADQRAAQILRAAIASAPAVAAAQAAPVAAPAAPVAAPAPAMPLPTVPARPTPLASAPFRDASGRVDTAAVAEAQGRVPSAARQPAAAFADMTPEEQLAEAEAQSQEVYAETAKMLEEAPRKAAEQKVAAKEQQIKDLQRQLAEAQAKRSSADIGRLTRMLRAMLQSRTTVDQELRKIEEASREPMFIGP